MKYALIIGNDTYLYSGFPALTAPVRDVEELSQVLGDPDIGGFEVQQLINAPEDKVTRSIERFFRNRQRDDLLLLHFSGHGVLDINGRLHLAVTDTSLDELSSSSIPARFVSEQMDATKSSRIILMLDCCHSGAFAEGTRGVGTAVGSQKAFEGTGYGRWVLTATDETQYAWEGDCASGTVQPSIFTRAVVEGLKTGKADMDRDGFISVRDLANYVSMSIGTGDKRQTPCLWSYKEQDKVIIAENPAPQLPDDLVAALANPFAKVRLAAVRELGALVRSAPNTRLAAVARAELSRVASGDDSREVFMAASQEIGLETKTPESWAAAERIRREEESQRAAERARLEAESERAAEHARKEEERKRMAEEARQQAERKAADEKARLEQQEREVAAEKARQREQKRRLNDEAWVKKFWEKKAAGEQQARLERERVMQLEQKSKLFDVEAQLQEQRIGERAATLERTSTKSVNLKWNLFGGITIVVLFAIIMIARYENRGTERHSNAPISQIETTSPQTETPSPQFKDQQVAELYRQAVGGDSNAMNSLGDKYYYGQGVDKDYKEAVGWYRRAADAGNSTGMANLGYVYHHGLGVEKDYNQTVVWDRKAAEAGNSYAMDELGTMYQHGLGVEKDDSQAAAWYRKAADGGNADAMNRLGDRYYDGLGVKKDYKEAVGWYRKAADGGNSDGMDDLGYMYLNGRGIYKDYNQAAAWFRKAVDAGSTGAMFHLGYMYEQGWGMDKDDSQAVAWYRKAAQLGDKNATDALNRLGKTLQ